MSPAGLALLLSLVARRSEVASDDLGLGVVVAQDPCAVGEGLLVEGDGPVQIPGVTDRAPSPAAQPLR